MKNIALQRIQKMRPYIPPLSGRRKFRGLLLDFNERVLAPSPRVKQAIQSLLDGNTLQVYPEYGDLEKKLASYVGVKADQIMITNGSDQAIDLVFRTFTEKKDTVIIPTPSFAMFSQCAQIMGNNVRCPLYAQDDASFPIENVLGMIDASVKLIVICNPNNPTGTLVAFEDIKRIAKKAGSAAILVDEAYAEFSGVTAVSLIKDYPNIIITRTFSKAFGIPSLRIGYILAAKEYIQELQKIRGPYDVNMIAYIAASAALGDRKIMQSYVTEVMNKAKPMVEKFFTQNNISFYQSAGNFLLYKPTVEKEEAVLEESGVLVRPQNKINIEGMLRVSIGTVEQMKRFITIYKKRILQKSLPKKCAFIDRDGTLIYEPQDTFQIDSIEKLKILDGVINGLKKLVRQGYTLIMVTNQDGLGTASFPKADFLAPQNKLLSIFKKNGIVFTNIFICPHLPEKNCSCRKPKTGLLNKFFRENLIDKNNSFVCGDRETDKQFAQSIGISFVTMQTNGDFYSALKKGGIFV